MMRILFSLVGYFSAATIVSAALGYFYLRHKGTLSDEKMFQIVAVLHNVDLQAKKEEAETDVEKIPPEELSYDQQLAQLQGATLHFDVKQKMLAESAAHFDSRLDQLSLSTNWYTRLREEVEAFLKEQTDRVTDKSLETVVNNLKMMDPAEQVKPLILKMVKEKRVDEVIAIFSRMAPGVRGEALLAFDTPEDLEVLHEIMTKILDGSPIKPFLQQRQRDLEERIAQEQ